MRTRSAALLATLMAMPTGSASAQAWRSVQSPAEAGYSSERIAQIGALADSVQSAAVMIVANGNVLAAWGDVARPLPMRSIRKSLLSGLYGWAVAEGRVDLDATLAQLGIDDQPALSVAEKRARVRDLLAARSGVYHAAAYAGSEQAEAAPARFSHAPGSVWFYNNWDFNAAEAIYELGTAEDLYRSFEERIARPLGMEDYDPARGFEVLEPGNSRIPAHTQRLSARDLARFALLYLRDGRWQDRQVIPAQWVKESTTSHSTLDGGAGYGYMWWTYPRGSLAPARYPSLAAHDVVMARGSGGQALFIVPGLDMVLVHLADSDNARPVPGAAIWRMVEMAAAARSGTAAAAPRLVDLRALPLASQLPAPQWPSHVRLTAAEMLEYAGNYAVQPRGSARVYVHEGRLFASMAGQGEVEILGLGDDRFDAPAEAGLLFTFTRTDGAVTGLTIRMGGRTMTAQRVVP